MKFFKHIALTIIEAILLITGVAVSYRVAFGATGWANRRIINVVGRRIGWRAYSWVLSQIHWGVRISFADGMGQAIGEVTEIVSQRLVSESRDANNSLSKSEAQEIAKNDVKKMANRTDKWSMDYEIWKWNPKRKQITPEPPQWIGRIKRQFDDFLSGFPI